jgi:hypothetical protein
MKLVALWIFTFCRTFMTKTKHNIGFQENRHFFAEYDCYNINPRSWKVKWHGLQGTKWPTRSWSSATTSTAAAFSGTTSFKSFLDQVRLVFRDMYAVDYDKVVLMGVHVDPKPVGTACRRFACM